ncbi:type II toxin-antitoxin system RelE/ParE family toxin [Aquisalimonas asiatica]|uniref:Phage-related protein n=1 Tax=Aquisalimonas asiatica TaxID=406100 RepID=A0A1H8SQ44_9GAMM|nr:type II toxin-antitoxin system RelE/ParE family toxin [Aquisalimonas asiatica]SEO80303.1 Phage-related protein [Aquisalimonas asiatica]
MKGIEFWGDSLDVIRNLPEGARAAIGFQLDRLQRGLQPDDFKPMKTIGSGVEEMRVRDAGNAYRVIYFARVEDAVHVLHAFQKKTEKTSKQDLAVAAQRFKQLDAERRP